MAYVYLVTNKLNGKKYIGSSRKDQIDENYYGSGKIIKDALKKYGKDLVKIKDKDAFKLFFESLKYDEQLLLTRALKQTPAEFKKLTNEAFVKGFQKAVNEKTIEIPKIPLKNLLWIKQVFVEGGISLTTGVGLTLAKAIYDKQQSENEINKKFTDPNKKIEFKYSDKSKTELDSLANLLNIEPQIKK